MKNKFKKFYYNYLEINWLILALFLLSLFAIIDIKLRIIVFPELFDNGSSFENEIYNLSLAYLASFIFYYIVVFLQEKKNRRLFHAYVSKQIDDILRSTTWIVSSFIKNDNPNKYPYQLPEKKELKRLIEKSKPNDDGHRGYLLPDKQFQQISIWQTIVNNKNEVVNTIDKLSIRAPQFDYRLTNMLMEIEECTLFYVIEQNGTHHFGKDLKVEADLIIKYYNLLNKISSYTKDRYGSKSWDDMFTNDPNVIKEYEDKRKEEKKNN